MASDEREIRTMHSIWIDAVNAGDLARLLTLVAEDVVFLTPGQAPFEPGGIFVQLHGRSPADADLLHQRVGRGRCCQRGRLHAEPRRTVNDAARRREGGTVRRTSHDGISQAARRSLASVPRCPHFVRRGLTIKGVAEARNEPSDYARWVEQARFAGAKGFYAFCVWLQLEEQSGA